MTSVKSRENLEKCVGESEWTSCPECKAAKIVTDPNRGEQVCGECGLVLSHHNIDRSREGRRSFSMDEKSQRDQTGSPISPLLPDLGLSTVIDTNGALSQQMKRIIKWNTRLTWNNRNMLIAATEIKRIGSLLNVPQRAKEYAAKIYRQAFKLKLLRRLRNFVNLNRNSYLETVYNVLQVLYSKIHSLIL